MASWPRSDDRTHPSSHTTYAALTIPEKEECLHQMHRDNVRLKSQIAQLREKISTAVNNDSVTIVLKDVSSRDTIL